MGESTLITGRAPTWEALLTGAPTVDALITAVQNCLILDGPHVTARVMLRVFANTPLSAVLGPLLTELDALRALHQNVTTRHALVGDEVLMQVAQFFELSLNALRNTGRRGPAVLARHTLMYVLRTEFHFSLVEIGTLCLRDHSTVIHGVDRIEERLLVDALFVERVATLTQRCRDGVARRSDALR